MKLLLVNPYFKVVSSAVSSPPLNLLFLGTYVRDRSDCEVEIIDPIPQNLTEKQVLKKVKNSDIVGLTCLTASRFQCFDFARKVKQSNPDCKLVVGGPHVNTLDKLILQYYPFIDAVVRSEGEATMLDLVKGRPYKKICGITWKSSKRIIRNPDRPFIQDIDTLYCDFSLIDIKKYTSGSDLFALFPDELGKLKTLDILASRGCPFRCTFCASEYWKRTWRALSPEELVRRIEILVSQYSIEHLRFYDDLFTVDRKRVLKFCELLRKRKLNISFRVQARIGTGRDVLEALKKVGCKAIALGIESGSDKILEKVNKRITTEQIKKTIRVCKELDYWVIGYFMTGLPLETLEDFMRTLKFVKLCDSIIYSIHTIYPNTPFYNELKQRREASDYMWFDKKLRKHSDNDNLYYCSDIFPSANFNMRELGWLKRLGLYYNYICHPEWFFASRLKGPSLPKSAIDILLKGRIGMFYRKWLREKEKVWI